MSLDYSSPLYQELIFLSPHFTGEQLWHRVKRQNKVGLDVSLLCQQLTKEPYKLLF